MRNAVLAVALLQATLASIRCRDFIEQGHVAHARVELYLLASALHEADSIGLTGESADDAERLRAQAAKLELLLSESPAA
jgi:hypothetical protein